MRLARMATTMLCVGGVVVTFAITAAPAAAACKNPKLQYGAACETELEHEQFLSFSNCPFATPELSACVWGLTTAKEAWGSRKAKEEWETRNGRKPPGLPSEFQAGNTTVLLKTAITLRGGTIENEETGALTWFGAEGAPTIDPEAQTGPPLTKDVDTALLSPSERERYSFYTKQTKQTAVTATVELAGPPSGIGLNETNLLTATGTAFTFPVKVKLGNPFLGSTCYVGSDEHPIVTEFSTGTSGTLTGKVGIPETDAEGLILTIKTSTLVSNTFAAPGVEGCGVGGGADPAVDAALGLPSPAGKNVAVIDGSLRQAGASVAKEGLEGQE